MCTFISISLSLRTDFSMMVKLYTDAEKWDDAIFLLKSCFLNCKEKHGWSLSYSSLHGTVYDLSEVF